MIYCHLDSKYAEGCKDTECDHFSVCDTEDDEEEGYCPQCSGSGEGMHDGSTCSACGGSGAETGRKSKYDDPPDWWIDNQRESRDEF